MNVYLDPATLFDLFCIVQGLTTAAVLFRRSGHPANRWLAWLMLGLTLQVLDYFLSLSGVYAQHKWLYFLPLFYSWSFGPLLYGYIRARAGLDASARRPGAPAAGAPAYRLPRGYFAPVAMQALFYGLLMAQSLDTKAWFWINVHKPYTRYVEYYVAAGLVLWAIGKSRSFVARQPDRWLGRWLTGLAVFYVVAMVEPLVNQQYLPAGWPKFWLTTLLLPFFVYTLALVGLLYDRIRKPERSRSGVPAAPTGPAPTADQRERLLNAIRQQQLYKDPDLTLTSLAQHLGETPNTVSRVLNAGVGQSFSDLINTYRVAEVKRRMAAGDAGRVTLLALAFDAGFASKTTFNRVFKEQTGQTPKEWLKNTSQTITWDDATA